MQKLALFDLDNTLLAGDSEHAFGEFICQRGLVDVAEHRARNDAFYADYCAGCMDIVAFQRFNQAILTTMEAADLKRLQQDFVREIIEPMILPKGEALLAQHQKAGDKLVIITATNRFITERIAERLGVETLIATECGLQNGRYSGELSGTPCYQQGKVVRLNEWLAESGFNLEGSHFYSDSRNDLPLLEAVTYPVAVDPDDKLRKVAEERGWRVISLR